MVEVPEGEANSIIEEWGTSTLWNQWLGNTSKMKVNMISYKGKIPYLKNVTVNFCKICFIHKHKKVIYKHGETIDGRQFGVVHSYVHGPTSAFLLEVQCIMLLSLTNETRTFWVVSWRTDLKYLTSSRNRQLLWKTKHVWRLSVLSCTMRLNTKIKNLLIAMFNVGLLCWKQFLKHLNKRVWMVGWNICWKKGTISMRLHARLPNM